MNISNLVKKARTALRQNRHFSVATGRIVFFMLGAMGVYALSLPAAIKVPVDTQLGYLGYSSGRLSYHDRMYSGWQRLSEESTARLKGQHLGNANTAFGAIKTPEMRTPNQIYTNAGALELYTARSYGESFLLVGVLDRPQNGDYGVLFGNISGITVRTGADYLEKFHLKNNTGTVTFTRYQKSSSSGSGKLACKATANPILWNRFVNALYAARPEQPKGQMANLQMKILDVTTRDGVLSRIILYEGGYVRVNNLPVVLKVNSLAFNEFWDSLK